MAGKSIGLWPIVAGTPAALLLSAVFFRQPSPSPPQAAAPISNVADSVEAPAQPSQYCVSRLLSPFRAMAGRMPATADNRTDAVKVMISAGDAGIEATSAPVKPSTADWLDRVADDVSQLAAVFGAEGKPARVESMIATLPDPVDSGLTYEFEVALRSLRRGVEHPVDAAVFFRDRSWLPWDDREVESAKRSDSELCRLSLPGVMLFRGNSSEQPRLFVLLLAGESPTSGLRQMSMLNALRIQARLDRVSGSTPSNQARTVRIVGPAFSGSAQSLRLALRTWALEADQPLSFTVISGSATGPDLPRWLGTDSDPSPLSAQSIVRFSATIVPEASTECAYFNFLTHRLGVAPEPNSEQSDVHRPIPLEGVATLSESGTEFGSALGSHPQNAAISNPSCHWAASSTFHFPFHVSALRDAYESLDRVSAAAHQESSIARITSLDAPLREARISLDAEANPSDKTRAAVDIGLNGLIEQMSERRVRHVAIHATDVGDAIFLARKIRDIAPDVRLAFFDADALLLHPAFQREVIGSLVVSPYPFLGLTDFKRGAYDQPLFEGFESGVAEGLYNAVLAQRSPIPGDVSDLSEYSVGSGIPLPIWIAAVGRGSFVPSRITPTLDCAGLLYGAAKLKDDRAALCNPTTRKESDVARRSFMHAHTEPLGLDPHVALPHSWDFLFVVLCLAFWLDSRHQDAVARRFSKDDFPEIFEPASDQRLDRAIARTKWQLYAAIRSFLFLMASAYMTIVYLLGVVARDSAGLAPSGSIFAGLLLTGAYAVVVAFLAASADRTLRMVRRFAVDYRKFSVCVGATLLPWSWKDLRAAMNQASTDGRAPTTRATEDVAPPSFPPESIEPQPSSVRPPTARIVPAPAAAPIAGFRNRLLLSFGFLQARERQDVARTSFAQLRILASFTVILAFAFSVVLLLDTADVAEFSFRTGLPPEPLDRVTYQRLTLTVLRAVQLTSGVSPSTPSLLCMVCVYLWAVGRMARLALAHSISRASPSDGETDLVSTPIRLILYPGYVERGTSDAGFTDVERALLNAIWRPLTGRYYPMAAFMLAIFPLVLFTLIKPFSTLEGFWGTLFLGAGLGLSASLVGFTLVQLIQYWLALESLLKRTLEHPLGPAFRQVPLFARDSIDQLVSGSCDEILRWAACARQFGDLRRHAAAFEGSDIIAPHLLSIERYATELSERRVAALASNSESRFSVILPPDGAKLPEPARVHANQDEARATLEASLARHVIRAAAMLSGLLEQAWSESAVPHAAALEARPARISGQVEVSWLSASGSQAMAVGLSHEGAGVSDAGWKAPRAVALVRGSSAPPPASHAAPHVAAEVPAPSHDPSAPDALTPLGSRYSSAELDWLRSAQVFVTTVVTLLINRHLKQFRYFLYVSTGCGLLLLLAVASYSFEPYRLLLTFMWVVIGSVVTTGFAIFVQMDRNTLLSHVAGTHPDQLTWNAELIVRILAWVVVPLLGVAAVQYPRVASVLFDLVAPFVRALH